MSLRSLGSSVGLSLFQFLFILACFFFSCRLITLQQQQQQQRSISVLDGGCEAEALRCWNSIRQRRTTKWREGWEEEEEGGCRMGGRGVGVMQTWADCESSLSIRLSLQTSPLSVSLSGFPVSFLSVCFSVSFRPNLLFAASITFRLSLSVSLPHLRCFSVFPSIFLFLSVILSFHLFISVSLFHSALFSPSVSVSFSVSLMLLFLFFLSLCQSFPPSFLPPYLCFAFVLFHLPPLSVRLYLSPFMSQIFFFLSVFISLFVYQSVCL